MSAKGFSSRVRCEGCGAEGPDAENVEYAWRLWCERAA